jgi:hypothetical protein
MSTTSKQKILWKLWGLSGKLFRLKYGAFIGQIWSKSTVTSAPRMTLCVNQAPTGLELNLLVEVSRVDFCQLS